MGEILIRESVIETFNCALVFDLDGTLVNSVGSVAAAVNASLAFEDLAPLSIEEMKDHVGEGAVHMLTSVLQCRGVSPEDATVKRCVERYVAAYLNDPTTHTTIYPGVVEVLRSFERRNAVMGVCTNKPGALANAVLMSLGLMRYFCAVVSPDDTAHRKPDGRHIHATLAKMNAGEIPAILVGDSETDMLAGKNAGLKTVLVTYGYRKGRIAEESADVVIDRFADLPTVLDRLL
jgi:phosphoglycolate phosphatase